MTFGDVLAFVAALAMVGVAWGATVLVAAVLFPVRCDLAATSLKTSPGRCFGFGFLVTLTAAIAALICSQVPGPLRLLAAVILAGYGLSAAVGSAAIARIAADRINTIGTNLSPFASLTRGTALLVIAGYTPIIGWILGPFALLLSVGAAADAYLQARRNRRAPAAPIPAVPMTPGFGQAQ